MAILRGKGKNPEGATIVSGSVVALIVGLGGRGFEAIERIK